MMISGPKTLVRESEWMRVFKFHDQETYLLERTEKTAKLRANYYQALESLRGLEAVPVLRQHYNQYRNLIAGKDVQNQQLDIWIDYLQCAKTLLILTRDLMFE